jgi:hypothetical protein
VKALVLILVSAIVASALTYFFAVQLKERDLANQIGTLERRLEEEKRRRSAALERIGALQQEVERPRKKPELLTLFGDDFTFYKKWEPYKDLRQPLILGRCEPTPCAAVQFEEITGRGPTSAIKFSLLDRAALLKPLIATLPLRKGCTREIGIRRELLDVTVEDDSHQTPALGFVVRPRPPTKPPITKGSGRPAIDLSPLFDLVIRGRYSCDQQEYHCRSGAGTGEVDRTACLEGSMGRMDEVAARGGQAHAWVEEATGEWAFYVRRAGTAWQKFVRE